MMLELPLHERQKAYFQDLLNAAKPVKIVPAADVLEDYELDYIRHVIKPKPKECYRNSHLLCEAFPERILYCEGKQTSQYRLTMRLTRSATHILT